MKLTKKEFMEKLKTIIGDKDDDDTLSFLEDCNDTLGESDAGSDWEEKYNKLLEEKNDLDKSWRAKYRERFFSFSDDDKDKNTDPAKRAHDKEDEPDPEEEANKVRFDDLFNDGKE